MLRQLSPFAYSATTIDNTPRSLLSFDMTRNRPLDRKALKAAKKMFLETMDVAGLSIDPRVHLLGDKLLDILIRKTIVEYLDQSKDAKLYKRNYAKATHQLAEMKIGEVIEVDAQPLQSIRQRMVSARQIMNNPDAIWNTERNGLKVTIVRNEDNAQVRYFDPGKNPKVAEMVRMKPGDSIISAAQTSTRGAGQMGSNSKIMARRYLHDPEADWTVRMTTKGIRLTRIK